MARRHREPDNTGGKLAVIIVVGVLGLITGGMCGCVVHFVQWQNGNRRSDAYAFGVMAVGALVGAASGGLAGWVWPP